MEREITTPSLVIWGAGGHAKVVADIVRLEGIYSITGFLDDIPAGVHGKSFSNAFVLGGREQLPALLAKGTRQLIIGIGDCEIRLAKAGLARNLGFDFATATHPRAIISISATVGPGTVVAAGAVIGPGAVVGDHVIVNTLASVDHDCRLEDGVHISPGVRLGGRVVIGRGTWVGMGALIRDGIRIGEECVIGAGALLLSDIPAGSFAHGHPATPRARETRHE